MVNKNYWFVLGCFLMVVLIIILVSAVTELVVPESDSDAGGTMAFNCSTNQTSAINATVLYAYDANATYGYLTVLTEPYNDTSVNEGQITFNTSVLDISGLASSGTYNFSCMIWLEDSSEGTTFTENSTAVTGITIDNTNPVVNLTYPVTASNFSNSTIVFNTTITDNYNVTNVSLWGNWSAGWHQNATLGVSANNTITTFNIDSVNLSDGIYVWNVYSCDNWSNCAFATANSTLTVDTTAPVITHSCSASSVTEGDSLTCTCTAVDALSTHSVSYTASPSTSSAGTKTTTCTATDFLSNSRTSTITYTVTSPTSVTTAPVTPTWTTETIGDTTFQDGITRQVQAKKRLQVTIDNEKHHVGVLSLTSTTATIEVASTPQEVTMEIGEERKFEVTGDDYYDIYVKLNSIESNMADITIKYINELISEEELIDEESVVTGDEEEGEEIPLEDKSKIWIWIIVIVIVLIIAGILYRKKVG